ncbi:MAG: hypothetical protein WAM30_03575, partial [Candidatus Dormiibacterota bacterium]
SFWQPHFLQAGGHEVEGTKSKLDTKPGLKAMQALYDYAYKYGASAIRSANGESGSAMLPQGQTASTISLSTWAYATFQQLAPSSWKNIRALLYPQVDPSHPKYYTSAGYSSCVNAKSSNKSAAFELAHMIGSEFGPEIWKDAGIVVPVANWAKKYSWSSVPDAPVWQQMSAAGTPMTLTVPAQLSESYRESEFQPTFEAVVFEKQNLSKQMSKWNGLVQQQLDQQGPG